MKEKIKKAPGATSNSYVTEVKGFSVITQSGKWQAVNAAVFFTSDEAGENLDIVDPTTKKQIVLPFGPIERLIEFVRNKRVERDMEDGLNDEPK